MRRLHAPLAAAGLAVFLAGSAGLAASDTRLVDAARAADLPLARKLLAEGIDAGSAAGDGTTALHWAAYRNQRELAQLLIAAHASPNAANDLGVTPLWLAASEADASLVRLLLDAGADPARTLATGETPVMAAARAGHADIIRLLAKAGADVNARETSREQTALMLAAAQGHAAAVEALVEAGADVQARSKAWKSLVNVGSGLNAAALNAAAGADDYDPSGITEIVQGGWTPLMFAAKRGDIASAAVLVKAGADIDAVSPQGTSALVIAAHSGNGRFAQRLLDLGADPHSKEAGYTALHAAILRRDSALAQALVAHGADVNAPVEKATPARRVSADYALGAQLVGATPLWLASRFSEPEMVALLPTHGADPAFTMSDGWTVLMAPLQIKAGATSGDQTDGPPVTEKAMLETMRAVLEIGKGANVNQMDKRGNTALHHAAGRGFASIAEFLIAQGADPAARNANGQTPLDVAKAQKRTAVIDLLTRQGEREGLPANR